MALVMSPILSSSLCARVAAGQARGSVLFFDWVRLSPIMICKFKMGLRWAHHLMQTSPIKDSISDPFLRREERGDAQMSSPMRRHSRGMRSVLVGGKDGSGRVEGGWRAYGYETRRC
jgi:hypothetical protein